MAIKLKLPGRITRLAGKGVLAIKKKSPEILFCVGVASFGMTIVSAIKASKEQDDILLDHEEALEEAKNQFIVPDDFKEVEINGSKYTLDMEESPDLGDEDYEIGGEVPVKSEKEVNRAVRKVYTRTALRFIRLYSKTAGFALVSLACFGGVYKVLSGRVAAGLATISGLENYISLYEKRNIELNGKKSHEMCKYGYKDIERTYEDPETGEMVTEVERVPAYEADEGVDEDTMAMLEDGPSVVIFCTEESAEYKGIGYLDRMTLDAAEADAIRIWRTRGWVCENDVRTYLGMTKTIRGQRKGLIYREGKDHGPEPSLGIDSLINDAAKNGTRKSWILETNFSDDIFVATKAEDKKRREFEEKLMAKRLSEEVMA